MESNLSARTTIAVFLILTIAMALCGALLLRLRQDPVKHYHSSAAAD